jgi:hypothetical protein
VATGSQQEAAAAVWDAAAATATSTVPPVTVPATGGQAAVVEIPDDDARRPSGASGRIGPRPPSSLRRGMLAMREDGCVVPRQPTHGAEASSSRAILPTPDVTVVRPEQ